MAVHNICAALYKMMLMGSFSTGYRRMLVFNRNSSTTSKLSKNIVLDFSRNNCRLWCINL